MTSFREPARHLAEPAPYLNKFHACPLCDGCPPLLYPHKSDCAWWVRYLAAGERMREPIGPEPSSGWPEMTSDELGAVLALWPAPPPRPPWWRRLLCTPFGVRGRKE